MLQKLGGKNIKHPKTNKEEATQALNAFFCQVYKYQFWKHHIIGFNPLIKNALKFIEFAVDPHLNGDSTSHQEIFAIAKQYDEQYDKLYDAAFDEQVAFSTKVI